MEGCILRSRKVTAAVAVAVVAAGGVAATQAANGAAPKRPLAHTYKLSAAKHGLAFNVKTIHAKKGKITLRMGNPASFDHAIAVGSHKGKVVGKGGTSTVTVTLKKGTYTFYCPVPGHRAGGMKGKLIVS
jgi:plastocyanin